MGPVQAPPIPSKPDPRNPRHLRYPRLIRRRQSLTAGMSVTKLQLRWQLRKLIDMSVEELKRALTNLSAREQDEVTAFLFHLRHRADSAYQRAVDSRLADTDKSHWITPEEFEERLDRK